MAGTGSTYFSKDCFRGSSELVGTGSTFFPADYFGGSSDGLFKDQFLLDLRSFLVLVLGSN